MHLIKSDAPFTTALLQQAAKIEGDTFFHILDDHWLKAPFPVEAIEYGMAMIELCDFVAVRYDAGSRYYRYSQEPPPAGKVTARRLHINSQYRMSFQPTLYDKKYLLAALQPGTDPWDAELHRPLVNGGIINVILPIFSDIMQRGARNVDHLPPRSG